MEKVIVREPGTGLVILPNATSTRMTHTGDLLSSLRMQHVIEAAQQKFDYIIIDLPPLGPVVDARAAQYLLDAFVFVAEWGKTPRSVVRSALETDLSIYQKVVGVILNKVDPEALKFYEGQSSTDYYSERYSNYYRNAAE
jgi:polysaccharide biosynthesis transport protein